MTEEKICSKCGRTITNGEIHLGTVREGLVLYTCMDCWVTNKGII
jgi:DNA-directed RNA polymerase subunit RPC12/RpoP